MTKPELLAPAGDLERLKIAYQYGADAVYIGSGYNLRANADNFSLDDIKEGCEFAHKLGKKLYVTVNIAMHNKEAKTILNYLLELDKIGVDAIIVSDPAIIDLALKNTNLEVHLSTQNSTLNKESVAFWKDQGVSRIVLARECAKEDILDIKNNVSIELEVFIHGAMCASYSGRCVMSNFLTNRDSNRGGCSQICRWDFDLLEDDKDVKGDRPFTFCTKDLSMIKHIPDLIELGVDSLKVEGRMRSEYYIATIIKVYRQVIDSYFTDPNNYKYDSENEKILRRCANRDSTVQFFNGIFDHSVQYYNGRREVTNQDYLAKVIDYKDGLAKIGQRNYFSVGDEVIIFGPSEEFSMVIEELYDEKMNKIDVARHPKEILYLKVPSKIDKNYMIKRI